MPRGWNGERKAMIVTAERRIEAGEELLCSYGGRSNVLLYRTYGFTTPACHEPAWSYIVRPTEVVPIYETYLPEESGTADR